MSIVREFVNCLQPLALAATIALLSACGGGDSGRSCVDDPNRDPRLPGCGTTTPPVPPTTTAATVQLLVSTQQINSDGLATVALTVSALDANRQGIGNRPVQITVSDPENTAYVTNFSQSAIAGSANAHPTDANGQLTATLSTGASRANRAITLSVTVDAATISNTVNVVGTNITLSGTNALAISTSTQLGVLLADSSGRPIANAPVTVASANGNTVLLSSQTTDAQGQTTVTVTATKAGNDTITVSAYGASGAYKIAVSAQNFVFTNPPPSTTPQVPVNSAYQLSLRWTDNGAPVQAQPIIFAATRGTLSASSVLTDANGVARTTISSTSPGPTTITVSDGRTAAIVASANMVFISGDPADKVSLQADKTTVATNPPGTNANVVNLTAVARDVQNNLVRGATINFRIETDPTGGSLSTASAITNDVGVAKAQYIPSSVSSPTNGVELSATALDWAGNAVPYVGKVKITVGGQRLFIRIGSDMELGVADANYLLKYSAFVTDAGGNPVVGAPVQFLFRPAQDVSPTDWPATCNYYKRDTETCKAGNLPSLQFDYAYLKGYWVIPDVGRPYQVINAGCFNEDANFNGILDQSTSLNFNEDWNHDGMLWPGNVFSVNISATTNSLGYATGTLAYPKAHGMWTRVTLKATTQVVGTEAQSEETFLLPYREGDTPPGVIGTTGASPPVTILQSPYGNRKDCANPN